MNLHDLHFHDPSAAKWLLALPLVALLLWILWRAREKAQAALGTQAVFSAISFSRSTKLELARASCLCLAWGFATVAYMQPLGAPHYRSEQGDEGTILEEQFTEEEGEVSQQTVKRRKAHDVLFLLDASASMAVKDTRTGATRLDFAKELIDELLSQLDGQSAALYAFTSEIHTVSPPTMDYLFLRLVLRIIGINEGDVAGTDLVEALEGIRRKHFKVNKDRLLTVVLLTDGGDTQLETLTGEARKQGIQAVVSRVKEAEKLNLRLFTVGIGSPQGAVIPGISYQGQPVRSSLDEELLEQLADSGRGRYYFANKSSVLSITKDIIRIINQDDPYVEMEESEIELMGSLERVRERDMDSELIYRLYFQYPLALAIICLGLAWLLPESLERRQDL